MVEAGFSCVHLPWHNLRGRRHISVQCDVLAQILNSRDSLAEDSANIQMMQILGADDQPHQMEFS
jgi:hypothetical protein